MKKLILSVLELLLCMIIDVYFFIQLEILHIRYHDYVLIIPLVILLCFFSVLTIFICHIIQSYIDGRKNNS